MTEQPRLTLYIFIANWGPSQCPLHRGCPYFRGVHSERFHCIHIYSNWDPSQCPLCRGCPYFRGVHMHFVGLKRLTHL